MMGLRIVVIDDEPHIRHVIGRKLQGAGYEVHGASNGADGLELIRRVSPCLVITDLQMPKMNGFELCSACREDPQTRELPIILVTGSVITRSEVEIKVEGLGKVYCLSKPFSPRELLQKVQNLVGAN